MAVILQVDFPSDGPFGDEMSAAFLPLAHSINNEDGMIWKIWTENRATGEAGGVYLFDCREHAERYAAMHCARLQGFGIRDIRSKIFDCNLPLSAINHADFLPHNA